MLTHTMRSTLCSFTVSSLLWVGSAVPALAVAAKTSPLNTPWTSLALSGGVPLPEYPRPQMTRPDWMNLNGEWEFRQSTTNDNPVFGQTLPERINVPFPPESPLSGIMRPAGDTRHYLFYRRTFTVPAGWAGRRAQLHVQACDNQCWVWINGVQVASHLGGYDRIDADIQGQLNGGTNEIVIKAYDPSDTRENGTLPAVGKQTITPNSIWYTPTSGIWQTVWIEPTAAASISSVDFYPNLASSVLRVHPFSRGDVTGHTVLAEAMVGSTVVGSAVGGFADFNVPVPSPHLWSPDDPYLYNLRVTLRNASGATVDQTMHYFGMREVGKKVVNGHLMLTLNGRALFNVGTLDQGFWPDGEYTAPTDAALAFDIQAHKNLGFNMVRKHIKIEPQRWFYHADRLGLLVWQDMPSLTAQDVNANATQLAQWEAEIREMIDEHRSSPAVIAYTIYNEGWGEVSLGDTQRIATNAKNYDPTRMINTHSGYNCCQSLGDPGNGDMMDWHVYVGPDSPTSSSTRFAVLGEFGGLGLQITGHQWSPWGGFQAYEWQADATAITNRYVGLITSLTDLMRTRGTSASVYTEITDVEGEVNGFWTYDRQVMKYDGPRVAAANQAIINNERLLDPQALTSLPVGVRKSFQVTTAGFTDRYIWKNGTNADTQSVTAASDAATKDATTFTIRAGLASASCYSFESVNPTGQFLRHSSSRVILSPDDGTALMRNDATWCARVGITGNGVSFESFNFPGRYIRHQAAQLWLSTGTGTGTDYNTATMFANDATWTVANPWSTGGVATPTFTATATAVATPTPTAAATATPAGTAVPIVSGSTYTVTSQNSGKCVDAAASGTVNATWVQQYTCNNSAAQQWVFTATDSGYYQVSTKNSATQIWDVSAAATTDGALVQLWTYAGATNQQWQPVVVSGPYYKFVARHSAKCLDVPNASTADSIQLQQWTCNGTGAQSFSVKLVGATPTSTPTPTPTARATATATTRATATATATARATATATATAGTGTAVNLSSAFNVNVAYSDSTTFPANGGIDGVGSAYSSTLLGTSMTWSSATFNFGAANVLNGVRNKTVTLPAGQFSTLLLLGTGVNGDQLSQTVRVNYNDGTSSTFTQTFSNWLNASQNVAGQSIAKSMAYRNKSTGVKDNRVFNLYGYSFALDNTRVVSSLVLPATNNVSFLAATLRTN